MMMKKIDEKHLYLPSEFWDKHELCSSLIEQIEEIIIKEEYQKLKYYPISLEGKNDIPNEGEDFLDFLLRTGRLQEHDIVVENNIVYALIIDICYFLQEALVCSKKMRLSVAFSLLRKPFIYNLIVLLRIIYEEDFIHKFNNTEFFDTTYIKDESKKELIKASLTNSFTIKKIDAELIYDLVFNKKNVKSIINMSEKALHLSTTRNKNNKTEQKNLNFIFSTYSDNISMWEHLYSKLPLLIIYMTEVIDSFVLPIVNLDSEQLNERLKKRIEILNHAR